MDRSQTSGGRRAGMGGNGGSRLKRVLQYVVHAGTKDRLGEYDQALDLLERAVSRHDNELLWGQSKAGVRQAACRTEIHRAAAENGVHALRPCLREAN